MHTERLLRAPDFLYGTAWKEERTAALTELAIHTGFRGIDTANQRRHYFEAGVGEGSGRRVSRGSSDARRSFSANEVHLPARAGPSPAIRSSRSLAAQVAQSMASSLEHLGTDHVDSYVLHGPSSGYGWTEADAEVWEAMRKERDAGRTRLLGVSNVSLRHLEQMDGAHAELPAFVQNRCFARLGWDREVRSFCKEHNIVYQGFSLLTANQEVLRHPVLIGFAQRLNATPPQVVFALRAPSGCCR